MNQWNLALLAAQVWNGFWANVSLSPKGLLWFPTWALLSLISHLSFTRPLFGVICWLHMLTSGCHLPIYGVICWLHIWVSPAHLTSWYHSLITHLGVTRPLCLRVIFTDCIPMCCASGWYSWFAHMSITCQIHFIVSYADNTFECHLPIVLPGDICWLYIWVSLAHYASMHLPIIIYVFYTHFTSWFHLLIPYLCVTCPLHFQVILTDWISCWHLLIIHLSVTCPLYFQMIIAD